MSFNTLSTSLQDPKLPLQNFLATVFNSKPGSVFTQDYTLLNLSREDFVHILEQLKNDNLIFYYMVEGDVFSGTRGNAQAKAGVRLTMPDGTQVTTQLPLKEMVRAQAYVDVISRVCLSKPGSVHEMDARDLEEAAHLDKVDTLIQALVSCELVSRVVRIGDTRFKLTRGKQEMTAQDIVAGLSGFMG